MQSDNNNTPAQAPSNKKTYFFVAGICFVAALILSILASGLKEKQEEAKKIDRSRQMLIAAKILDPDGTFLVLEDGVYKTGMYDPEEQVIIPTSKKVEASSADILTIYLTRIKPLLVNANGDSFTFEEENIAYEKYLEDNQKEGFSKIPLKLVYRIGPNLPPSQIGDTEAIGYVIPINGFGLWGPIYGYLAIQNNGDTVIGTTWYEHIETAGLGAEISLPSWQEQFQGKLIFRQSEDGQTNFERAPIGIIVIKGKVQDSLGNSPRAKSSVDGISGATLTGIGVTNAYRDVLENYRPFLIKLHEVNP